MLAFALVLAALTATAAAAVALRRRRVRPALAARRDPLPAGLHHLASGVSELSDLELHLHAERRGAKPGLGALLQPR